MMAVAARRCIDRKRSLDIAAARRSWAASSSKPGERLAGTIDSRPLPFHVKRMIFGFESLVKA
jgi:hypothetical protein